MGMPFYKVYSEGVLRGSLANAEDSTQLIWLKLLAMANETRDRDGYLRFGIGRPYKESFIIETCNTTPEKYHMAIEDFLGDIRDGQPRIQILEDGTIFITNFKHYQDKPQVKTKDDKQPISEDVKDKMAMDRVDKNPKLAIPALAKHITSDTAHRITSDINGDR